jgi:hypothetical protein
MIVPPMIVSSPPSGRNDSKNSDEPVSVSPKAEPMTPSTPMSVSVPTEALPVAVPVAKLTTTPAVASE